MREIIRKSHFLCILMFLSSPSVAHSEEYRLISSSAVQITLIDADFIRAHDGIVEAWTVEVRAPDHFLFDKVAYLKTFNEIKCITSQIRVTKSIFYSMNNRLLDSSSIKNPKWMQIVPATQFASVRDFMCGTDSVRKRSGSLGRMSLANIIAAIYSGPWPVD